MAERWGLHSIQRLLHTPPAPTTPLSAGETAAVPAPTTDPVAVMDAAGSPPGGH